MIAGALVVVAVSVNAYLLDGIVGWTWAAVGAAPTEFGKGYSDRSFRRVRNGMTREEVSGLLGNPLEVRLDYRDGQYGPVDPGVG